MNDVLIWVLAGIVVLVLLSLLIFKFVVWLDWYGREMRYLNREIQRSSAREKERWLRKKRKLKWSWLPFVKY